MLKLSRRQHNIAIVARRWHSSSSTPPQKDNSNQNNNELETAEEETITTKKDMVPEALTRGSMKKRISVKAQALDFSLMQRIPAVPSTQYLDGNAMKRDIFYTGFRPILTPVRRPVAKVKRQATRPLGWNQSACNLETFDDFSKVPQFVADKLVPFKEPGEPGNEIRLGYQSRKEQKEMERLSKEVYDFIKHFRK
jgi:hypothetical protein